MINAAIFFISFLLALRFGQLTNDGINFSAFENESILLINSDSNKNIICGIIGSMNTIEWYYRSTMDDATTDITVQSEVRMELGISSLSINQSGYYSCVINVDVVYSLFAVDEDSIGKLSTTKF